MRKKTFCYICLAVCLLPHLTDTYKLIERISRMNKADIQALPGDTVVIGWQYDLDREVRKETLDIFYCGYKDKIDHQLQPLVFTISSENFLSLRTHTLPSKFGIKSNQENKYVDHVHAYANYDQNAFYMEIKNINTGFNNMEIMCILHYKTPFAKDVAQGGTYTLQVGNIESASKRSEKLLSVRFWQTVIGAVTFVAIIILLAWLILVKWKQRRKGYVAVPTKERVNKRKPRQRASIKPLNRPPTPLKRSTNVTPVKVSTNSASVKASMNVAESDSKVEKSPNQFNAMSAKSNGTKPKRPPPINKPEPPVRPPPPKFDGINTTQTPPRQKPKRPPPIRKPEPPVRPPPPKFDGINTTQTPPRQKPKRPPPIRKPGPPVRPPPPKFDGINTTQTPPRQTALPGEEKYNVKVTAGGFGTPADPREF